MNMIKSINIQLPQLHFIHDTQVTEYLIQRLSFSQSADIMHIRIDDSLITGKSLQATAYLPVLFIDADFITILAENGAAYEASEPATYYDHIILHVQGI